MDDDSWLTCVVVNDTKSADSIACKFADVKPLNCVEVSDATWSVVNSTICAVDKFDMFDVDSELTCVVVNDTKSADSIACKFAEVKPLNCVEVNDTTCCVVNSTICAVDKFDMFDVDNELTCVVVNACKFVEVKACKFVEVNPFNWVVVIATTCCVVNSSTCAVVIPDNALVLSEAT